MKIVVITTSRADWNGLGMVAKELRDRRHEVQVYAVHGHLGLDAIEGDGFSPWLANPSEIGAIRGYDFAVVLGDRWETLASTVAISIQGRIPIAHIAGGDITEGSKDNDFRHAITKLSHLHFPTHEAARQRIIQMGESPERVFNFGSPSIDRILSTQFLPADEIHELFGEGRRPLILLNWQSETLGDNSGLASVLLAVQSINGYVVAVGAGNDPGGASINATLRTRAETVGNMVFIPHLPPRTYLSLLKHCDFLIGNSSSAFYEAPALGTFAIDVGDRQKGRNWPGSSIINVAPSLPAIADALRVIELAAKTPKAVRMFDHPFGKGHAARYIAETILVGAKNPTDLLRKKFHEPRNGGSVGSGAQGATLGPMAERESDSLRVTPLRSV